MKDRRTRKTKLAIETALLKLWSKKDIKNITVKELCETADIHKSTFYLHYKDIYDCAENFRDDIVDNIIGVISQYNFNELITNLSVIIEKLLLLFDKNKDFLTPFLKSSCRAPALYKVKQLMIDKILEKTDYDGTENTKAKCITSFVVCGILGVLEQNEFDEITPEITSLLTSRISNGFICPQDIK